MRSLILYLIFTSLLLTACRKQNEEASVSKKIDASHITITDILGNITGTIDSTDWTIDNSWSQEELNLFNFTDTLNHDSIFEADTIQLMGVPNPVYLSLTNNFIFIFNTNHKTLLKFVLTDEYLTRILYGTEKTSAINVGSLLAISCIPLQVNQYYRLYYEFINQNGNVYKKGHGDILLSQ